MKYLASYIYKPVAALATAILCLTGSFAQQLPDPTSNKPANAGSGTYPAANYYGLSDMTSTTKLNAVRTIIPDAPVSQTPGTNSYYGRQSADYFDGQGRPLQSVVRKGHAKGNDLVQVHVYDALGRETYQYLPYAAPTGGVLYLNSIYLIKFNQKAQMRDFYDQAGIDEPPYGQTIFDNSPLNRVVEQQAPGRSWVGSNRGTKTEYRVSQPAEVRLWTIGSSIDDVPVSTGWYADGALYVTTVTDEDGKFSITYTDQMGRVILKKQFLYDDHQPVTAHGGYACTYYVYDDMGHLRYTLPPEAVLQRTESGNTWTITSAIGRGLCFAYLYDQRGRVVEKRIPGKEVEYFVYDKHDRMIFNQDGNCRQQHKWAFTIYDALDRPYISGLAEGGTATRQDVLNSLANYFPSSTTDLWYYVQNYNIHNTYPANLDDCKIFSYTYYDNYSQLSGLGFDATQFNGITLPVNNTVVPSELSAMTRGLPTGSKVRVTDPDNPSADIWLTTANYYDAKGRVIQTVSRNLQNDLDISSNIYYFQGMPWKHISKHVNHNATVIPGATDGAITNFTVTDTYERNLSTAGGNDLVKRHTQKINNGAEYELSGYSYDHLGRITVKQWTAGLALQEYNMRGFTNHIAFRKYDLDMAFEENLYYDNGFGSKLYNGNIAGITWSGGDHKKRSYGYSYDRLNRLTHAEFNQYTGTAWNKSQGYDFTASNITYDQNGNIRTMNQMAPKPLATGSVMMDALTYSYAPNSNMLINVKDAADSYAGLPDFKDDQNGNGTGVQEYFYDGNGGLERDDNKHISSITYNYLNKPEKITVAGQGVVTYTYDASGNRLRKKLTYAGNAQPEETWDYIGNFVYKNNELQYILNEEGRARPMLASNDNFPNIPVGQYQTKFVYDYFVKDHLGNVRSTVTSKPNAYQYLAMHNISTANTENLIFDNISNVRDTKPGGTSPDDMAARLNGAEEDHRIGTAIILATKPGDRLTFNVNAFYDGDYSQDQEVSAPKMLESLMGTLLGGSTAGPKPVPVEGLPSNQEVIRNIFSNPSLAGQLDALQQVSNDPRAPKAHLNYLWFDDKLQLQANVSGTVQIAGNPNTWTLVSIGGGDNGNTTVVDGGWVSPGQGTLVVYIDNQSIGKNVWFDNLSIGSYESTVIEEDHYYPFGLTLNTTATLVGKNPYKYQGIELERHFGLETYETTYRGLDPQLGRFNQIDPLGEIFAYQSPYASMDNNPVSYIDPDGSYSRFGAWWRNVAWGGDGISKDEKSGEWGVNYGQVDAKGDLAGQAVTRFQTKGARPESMDEARNRAADNIKAFNNAREDGNIRMTECGDWERSIDNKPLDAPYSGLIRAKGLLNMLEPVMINQAPQAWATKLFDAKAFAEKIVNINKGTEGQGMLMSGSTTPSSAINSALYYEEPIEQGASIFRSISNGHMFQNGNKRTAVAAIKAFAKLNGLRTVNQNKLFEIATKVATGDVSDISQIARMIFK